MGEIFLREYSLCWHTTCRFVHISIANHTTLICASNIYLNQLNIYIDMLIYCVAGCSPECKKEKIYLTALKLFQAP